jgi:hypothetical protein
MAFKEPIDAIFRVENLTIESDNWSVLCLLGFSITSFYQGESIQKTEKQEFVFRVKTKDVIDNEIKKGETFFYTTDCHQYNFKIATVPIDDMTGACLSKFNADFISREAL